jgi:hypothetical protein
VVVTQSGLLQEETFERAQVRSLFILFPWDDDILGPNGTKALMFEEIVDDSHGKQLRGLLYSNILAV